MLSTLLVAIAATSSTITLPNPGNSLYQAPALQAMGIDAVVLWSDQKAASATITLDPPGLPTALPVGAKDSWSFALSDSMGLALSLNGYHLETTVPDLLWQWDGRQWDSLVTMTPNGTGVTDTGPSFPNPELPTLWIAEVDPPLGVPEPSTAALLTAAVTVLSMIAGLSVVSQELAS